MDPDQELLRRFAQARSQAAFAELVSRNLNLVYAVALRRLNGHSAIAEDVTQMVFTDLARKARTLFRHETLAAWLYRSARYSASQAARRESRRRIREEHAMAISNADLSPAEQGETQQIQTQVDGALDRLSDRDRCAVVLRYYSAKSFHEIGNALGVTEEAARKRVERALDKLRTILAQRGITSTAAALSAALTGNAAMTAPAAFSASVAGAALSSASASGLWFLLGGVKVAVFGAGAAAVAAAGILVHQFKQTSLLREESERASVTIAALRADLAEAQRSVQVQQAHARQAEEDATLLLGAIRQTDVLSTTSSPSSSGPPDRALVDRRYQEAREHARAGRHAEALEGFLWCFDEGMPVVPSYAGVRVSFLVGELQKLASVYPPALTAIRARRNRAEQAMVTEAGERMYAVEFAALNDALGEKERSVAAFFQMGEHDPRRAAMEHRVMSALVEQRRYPEAARILSIDGILLEFERRRTSADRAGMDEKSLSLLRRSTTAKYVAYVEVLAGAGKPREAQRLIDEIVRWDRSEHASLSLREALRRSGRGEQLIVP